MGVLCELGKWPEEENGMIFGEPMGWGERRVFEIEGIEGEVEFFVDEMGETLMMTLLGSYKVMVMTLDEKFLWLRGPWAEERILMDNLASVSAWAVREGRILETTHMLLRHYQF